MILPSTQIQKSMSRYHNKDIKTVVALFPILKNFLPVEIKLEFIEAATRSFSLINRFVKSFENLARK